jgi:hypothetical protein
MYNLSKLVISLPGNQIFVHDVQVQERVHCFLWVLWETCSSWIYEARTAVENIADLKADNDIYIRLFIIYIFIFIYVYSIFTGYRAKAECVALNI